MQGEMRVGRALLLFVCFLQCDANSLWFLNSLDYSLAGTSSANTPAFQNNTTAKAMVMCAQMDQLSPRQRRICERRPDVVRAVYDGMQVR